MQIPSTSRGALIAPLFLFVCQSLSAQVTLALPSSVTIPPGKMATVVLSMTATTGKNPVAVEFILTGTDISFKTYATTATTNAGKTLYCNGTSPQTCVLTGLNQNTISNGNLVNIDVTNTGQKPALALSLPTPGPNAVAFDGTGISVTVTSSLTINTISPCDMSGDGTITEADVLAWLAARYSSTPCANSAADFNHDGVCNLVDLQYIVRAGVPGGSCSVP